MVTEGIYSWIRERTSYEVKGEIKVSKGEECEQETDELVNEFDVKQNFSSNSVVSFPHLSEVDERVNSCEKSTVQPSPALRNKFGYSICK